MLTLACTGQFTNLSGMRSFSASDAKNRFGQLIDLAQAGPVRVQRQGRDVAIVMSPEEFRRLAEAARGKANPAVEVEYLSLHDALYIHAEQLRLFGGAGTGGQRAEAACT